MAFDVTKWLKEDMAFSDAEIAELAPKLTPKADALEKGYLRQSDYSKNMDALKKSQTDLSAANDRLTAEMAEWATVQAKNEPITKKMRDDLDAAQLKVTQLTSRVERIATDAGLDPAKALEGIDQVVVKKDEPPPVDLSDYVKRGDLTGLASMSLNLPAELQSIADEHHELTGKRLDTRTIVRELQTRAGTKGNTKTLDPREIWEEQHKIPELRATRDKKVHDDEIAAAENRGREAALSEIAVPGSTPAGRHAPVFQNRENKPRESVLKRPQPGTTVNAAVGALRSGKYRSGGTGSGSPGSGTKTA
jgi:hypothetical protein